MIGVPPADEMTNDDLFRLLDHLHDRVDALLGRMESEGEVSSDLIWNTALTMAAQNLWLGRVIDQADDTDVRDMLGWSDFIAGRFRDQDPESWAALENMASSVLLNGGVL